jgi:hypothetical protein
MSRGHTKERPLGVIHAGPISSLHDPGGSPIADSMWIEKAFISDEDLFIPKGGWKLIEDNRRTIMRWVNRLPYKRDAESLMMRYAVAVGQPDLQLAFLNLWSILEKITGTIGARYDDTIKMATWGWRDRQMSIEILDSLRHRRNSFVHSATETDHREELAYLIKSFVDPHLIYLLRNEFRVSSLDEYAQYLSLNSDLPTLRRKRKIFGHAIRILEKVQKEEKKPPVNKPASVQYVMDASK